MSRASSRRLSASRAGSTKFPTLEQLWTDSTTSAVATGGIEELPSHAAVLRPADQLRRPDAHRRANAGWEFWGGEPRHVMGRDGVFLGSQPIRQVDGEPLEDGHFAAHAELLLQYSDVNSGYWTLMAGARGPQGVAGPPDGAFSLDNDGDLRVHSLRGAASPPRSARRARTTPEPTAARPSTTSSISCRAARPCTCTSGCSPTDRPGRLECTATWVQIRARRR